MRVEVSLNQLHKERVRHGPAVPVEVTLPLERNKLLHIYIKKKKMTGNLNWPSDQKRPPCPILETVPVAENTGCLSGL